MRSIAVLLAACSALASASFHELLPKEIRQATIDNFPKLFSLKRMLTYWNPDITEIPPCGGTSFDSLERVDASTDAGLARIRQLVLAEVPFKAFNHPRLNEVVEKYKDWEVIADKFRDIKSHAATASHNHFMWFKSKQRKIDLQTWNKETHSVNYKKDGVEGRLPFSESVSKAPAEVSSRAEGYTFAFPPPHMEPVTFPEWWSTIKADTGRVQKGLDLLLAHARGDAVGKSALRGLEDAPKLDAKPPLKTYTVQQVRDILPAELKQWAGKVLVEFNRKASLGVGRGASTADAVTIRDLPSDLHTLQYPWGWWRVPPAELNDAAQTPHQYFTFSSSLPRQKRKGVRSNKHPIVLDLDPVFGGEDGFMMVDVKKRKGPQCRVGHPGIVAEGHEDGHRNAITLLTGMKRYVLLPPSECSLLEVMDAGPSRRHWALDMSDFKTLIDSPFNKQIAGVRAVETILKPGEVLYVPSIWHHYIVSLTKNFQCNVRSGMAPVQPEDQVSQADCNFKQKSELWEASDKFSYAAKQRWWMSERVWDAEEDAAAQQELQTVWDPIMRKVLKGETEGTEAPLPSLKDAKLLPKVVHAPPKGAISGK